MRQPLLFLPGPVAGPGKPDRLAVREAGHGQARPAGEDFALPAQLPALRRLRQRHADALGAAVKDRAGEDLFAAEEAVRLRVVARLTEKDREDQRLMRLQAALSLM